MESAALLDLLGNENRRRILRLLARKPCYVTEISEYLGVSPKAVIDHLRKLEEAGLVDSRVDEQRRKYFSIARNLRLEVNVSPYQFGTKSAYPASRSLDMTRCRYLSLHVDGDAPGDSDADNEDAPAADADSDGDDGDLAALADELERLQTLENELSMAQRWVQGQLTDVMDRISERFGERDGRFYAELLSALAAGADTTEAAARRVDASPEVARDALRRLEELGVVAREDGRWRLS
ncbi:metalloregulator ArsR/SmtB family transcription factor [Halosegnis sp.]|uniref:ArsR/SmtB family transcription factor n=1 Tax=Halosegnis sp. TaxID=2864959 RepID=UPI0035D4DF6E